MIVHTNAAEVQHILVIQASLMSHILKLLKKEILISLNSVLKAVLLQQGRHVNVDVHCLFYRLREVIRHCSTRQVNSYIK